MLSNKKITITSDVVINEERVATFGAVINLDTNEMSLFDRKLHTEACKIHRNEVRANQAEFEDFVYQLQDSMTSGE